ncbi:MAG: DMT family transporter [Solibacillus sp.]
MTTKKANFLLMLISIGWGTSYLFMKIGIEEMGAYAITFWRFIIAFLVVGMIFHKQLLQVNRKTLTYSAVSGVILFGVFITIIYGMETTDISTAGFLVSTTVVLVPILQAIYTRTWPLRNVVIGVIIVTVGLALMTMKGNSISLSMGAWLCLATAFFNALYIVATKQFVREVQTLQFGMYQLLFTALYGGIGMVVIEGVEVPGAGMQWIAILGLALICSAFGFVVQPVAQKYTTAESAGFIFSFEPIFAAIFAYVFVGEVISMQGYLGAGLILFGVFVANFERRRAVEKRGKLVREI